MIDSLREARAKIGTQEIVPCDEKLTARKVHVREEQIVESHESALPTGCGGSLLCLRDVCDIFTTLLDDTSDIV